MNLLLHILVLLATVALNCGGMMSSTTPIDAVVVEAEGAVTPIDHHAAQLDCAPSTQAVVMSEGQGLMRLAGSRPQRLLPTHGSIASRTAGKPSVHHHALTQRRHHTAAMRLRVDAAPFDTPAASDYYVYALRRLLC